MRQFVPDILKIRILYMYYFYIFSTPHGLRTKIISDHVSKTFLQGSILYIIIFVTHRGS